MKPMKYFEISELINPEILKILSLEAAWLLIPQHVRYGLDKLRELYGEPITINGGDYVDSGIRTQNCSTGATYSAHKCNRGLIAFDLKCGNQNKLRTIIEDNFADLHIKEVENYDKTLGWTHVAFHAERPNKLKIIN